MLSKLNHPNIVHFLGVHCGKEGDLCLIMEKLNTDLAQCLEDRPGIPLSFKLSILLDVSCGLLYLHMHSPPIVHRDLTATNVLLTNDMRAKIADLGVSKLMDIPTEQRQAQCHTIAPGNIYYMPPESLAETAEYDTKLDVFSFGHLTLYTATQQFPQVHEVKITREVLPVEGPINLHVLKRRKSLTQMGSDHCLYQLTVRCLQDEPEDRPTASEVNTIIKALSTRYPKSGQDIMKVCGEVCKLRPLVLL